MANEINYISQINAGGTVYDIATHHGITFKDGYNGSPKVWNGLTDIEVVIPTIADIVQNPIVFAGTVDGSGKIIGNDGHKDVETTPKEGYLIIFTDDCPSFDNGSDSDSDLLACEAGDMAIYDGNEWKVISGENQVKIVSNSGTTSNNKTTIKVGSSKDILTVEGKTLALEIDYNDFNNNHFTPSYGEIVDVEVSSATLVPKYIKLTQDKSEPITIGEEKEFKVAKKLKNNSVTLENADNLIKEVNFGTFDSGAFPTYSKNGEKTLNVQNSSLTGSDNENGYFVKNVTFEEVDDSDNDKIVFVSNITPSGIANEFFNNIRSTIAEGETADFTIPEILNPTKSDVSFVECLADNKTTVVTSITSGSFSLKDGGSDVATGFGEAKSSGEVLSSVSVTTSNNTNVFSSATVSDHVLSFGVTSVPTSVSVSSTYKSLVKKGIDYTAPVATDTSFIKSGFTKISSVGYKFDKVSEITYSPTIENYKIKLDRGDYTINPGKVVIPSGEFYSAISSSGTLPSLTGYSATPVKVTGTVDTELEYEETVKVNTLKSNTITLPGAYNLVDGNEGDENVIKVGSADSEVVIDATVDLSSCITGIRFK